MCKDLESRQLAAERFDGAGRGIENESVTETEKNIEIGRTAEAGRGTGEQKDIENEGAKEARQAVNKEKTIVVIPVGASADDVVGLRRADRLDTHGNGYRSRGMAGAGSGYGNGNAAEGGGSRQNRIRVAAYCRVSTDEERQLDSFENQVEHYTAVINENKRWELAKVYSDEGISGCSTRSRKGFLSMIEDCEQGRIDLIITKSISRFARNTQDSLNYTRKLRDMGIGIIFEKEGINTLESSGELLLTLFSCFAQEESRSISENTTWGIRSRFKQGIPHLNAEVLLGYDKDSSGKLVINEEQAATVRRIFRMFLEGFSLRAIASELNRCEVPGVHGEARWCAVTISRMLQNEKYKGALLMQKTYTVNYLTKHQAVNRGQREQYYIEDDHEPIIDPDEWEAVQQEIERRRLFREEHGLRGMYGSGGSAFYSKLFCRSCGARMQRIYRAGVRKPYWECGGCGRHLTDAALKEAFCQTFNRIIKNRELRMSRWNEMIVSGSALERLRARQMIEISMEGCIAFEIHELTQAVLQEAWCEEDGNIVSFTFLSGDR